MASESGQKKVTPPYATGAGLELFFDKIKKLKPAQLTTKWAEANELPFADAIVNTMKFLGAVEKDGTLKPEFGKLRLEGSPFQETLASLVQTAYKPIFDQVEDVTTARERDLNNAFKTAYDVGSPGRYVRPFLTLCELAGLRPVEAQGNGERSTQPKRPTTAQIPRVSASGPRPRSALKGARERQAPSIQVVLRLDVPWDAPLDEVRARVRALKLVDEVEE